MGCDVALLAGIKFFELLGEGDRNDLAGVIDYLKLAQGEPLFRVGDPGDSLFVVCSGAIELSITDTAGQKIVLTTAQEGDLFGEVALLDSGPRTATAVALEESELLMLDRGDLFLLFQKKPEAALHMLAAMGTMVRKADELLRTRISRNVNEEVEEQLTVFQKAADWIAGFSGGMPFLALNTIWFMVWIAVNTLPLGVAAFDPYPFGLLTMIVSLEAIFLSIFVLISQNRLAQKDRVRADVDYEVNVKAELEVAHLHDKVDRIYEKMLERFVRLEKNIAH